MVSSQKWVGVTFRESKILELLETLFTTHFTDMCTPHFFPASERRSTVDVRRRPGYKIWRFFKFEFSEVNINQYK